MQISPMPQSINYTTTALNFQKKHNRSENKNKIIKPAIGVGVSAMTVIGLGLIAKGDFNKAMAKKGLEFKDNILINKETGEKFTGKIKAYIGKIGFNRIEERCFQEGVITEKTHRNIFGQELDGKFYIEGKECLNVNVCRSIPGSNKLVAIYRLSKDGKKEVHLDMRGFNFESVFKWARKYVKEKGWVT